MLYALLTLLLLPTAAVIALYASRIRFSRRIVARTVPAQSSPARCQRTIVIAGDSTAFGVGALPEHTTAGRLAAGFRGTPPADEGALVDLLLRLSLLAEHLPEVVELDLNPVLALPDRCFAVDARVRVAEHGHPHRTKSW